MTPDRVRNRRSGAVSAHSTDPRPPVIGRNPKAQGTGARRRPQLCPCKATPSHAVGGGCCCASHHIGRPARLVHQKPASCKSSQAARRRAAESILETTVTRRRAGTKEEGQERPSSKQEGRNLTICCGIKYISPSGLTPLRNTHKEPSNAKPLDHSAAHTFFRALPDMEAYIRANRAIDDPCTLHSLQ